MTYPLHRWTS